MHGWSALRVSLNHFPRVASPPEGSLRITVNPLSGDFLVFRALSDLGGGEEKDSDGILFSHTKALVWAGR